MWQGWQSRLRHISLAIGCSLAAESGEASPFGTSYTASAVNFPGTDTAVLEFDGLDEALGSSGLIVGETSTSFVGFELLEFSLRTANGNALVGQQLDALATASVLVTDLHYFGDPTPLQALADSTFLWLTIDGVPQALSDSLGLGLVFAMHPLYPSIPVLLIDNEATTEFGIFAASALGVFSALVGPTLAAEIDDVHFGVAAAPVPEPGTAWLLVCGLMAIAARRRAQRRE
jgi:hypothetical protein